MSKDSLKKPYFKTVWVYSLETEVENILLFSADMYRRFFIVNNFIVLDRLLPGDAGSVYLPRMQLVFSKKEIEEFKKIDNKAFPYIIYPVNLYKKVEKFLPLVKLTRKMVELQKGWSKIEPSFWRIIYMLFPKLYGKKIILTIRPSSYGTCASFNFVDITSKNLTITIYVRSDMSIGNIAEAILSSLFGPEGEKEGFDWGQNEAVVDFLLKKTLFSQLFPSYLGTVESTSYLEKGKLISESLHYQRELGVEVGGVFKEQNGELFIQQKSINSLSLSEKRVLRFLIKNKNTICSFDMIAKEMWGDNFYDNFSYWAISKNIQRLREKIAFYGVTPTVIKTWRKEGYLLVD